LFELFILLIFVLFLSSYYFFKLPPSPSAKFFQGFLIGHRGCVLTQTDKSHLKIPENTLSAFRYAIEHGVDGVEFDITLTKDNVPVIMHDSNTTRTCNCIQNEETTSRNISENTLKNLQNNFQYKNGELTEIIPTLEETLELTQIELPKKI